MTNSIETFFEPFDMRRMALALRAVLPTARLLITDTGVYDNLRIVEGITVGKSYQGFLLVLDKSEPYIYNGIIKKYPFDIYRIDKDQFPPMNTNSEYVMFEKALPTWFRMKSDRDDVLNISPKINFRPSHIDRWKKLHLSSNDIRDLELKSPWSWTYEMDLNSLSGGNVLYCKSLKGVELGGARTATGDLNEFIGGNS